jgi:5-bromo-4-chloroindolyl phosphate hydrolysis protein
MKSLKVSRTQYDILQALTRRDIAVLRKYPNILAESKQLLRALKSVIKKIEDIPDHANRRKRKTAYKRVVAICKKAIDRIES